MEELICKSQALLKGKLYWYALRNSYDTSDNLFYFKADLQRAFEENEPERNSLMNKKELKYLQNLPKKITIYRGMTKEELDSEKFGISWTLKKKRLNFS